MTESGISQRIVARELICSLSLSFALPQAQIQALQSARAGAMGSYYDEIEIEDMSWDDTKKVFHYPCPCGDRFEISRGQLANYEDIATCPSCSLIIRIVYDPVSTFAHIDVQEN
jgi:diphthamide biosynthesis protein 3